MSKPLQWIIGLALVVILITTLFSTVMPFIFPRAGGYGLMHSPGMGGWGMPIFGLGMAAMWGGPLLTLGLVVFGGLWLFQKLGASGKPPTPTTTSVCSHCGQPLQPNWKACPQCGEKI